MAIACSAETIRDEGVDAFTASSTCRFTRRAAALRAVVRRPKAARLLWRDAKTALADAIDCSQNFTPLKTASRVDSGPTAACEWRGDADIL